MGYTHLASGETTNDDEACMYALELLGAPVVSMTLKAAIELGLIDELLAADGQAVTAEELAERLLNPAGRQAEAAAAAVDRMLRFLASHSVVRCTTELGPDGRAQRSYASTSVCKWLAGNGCEGSMAPMGLLSLDKVFMQSWFYLKDAVAEGVTPFDKAYGMPMFEYLGANEQSNTLFNQAMASHATIITKKLLESFCGFEGLDVLVDVGGGIGNTLQMITAQHKRLKGINYDLPHVIAQAPPIEGVEHVGGDMFDYIPTGNAILMKWNLHLWSDEDCAKVLKNCYSALPANGKIIIVEYVLPASPEPTLAAQGAFRLDVVMLNRLPGGKERTEREFTELAAVAGFTGGCKATYIFTNVWALEFIK